MTTINQAVVVDEIIQAFHSHGNLHLIFGVTSGEVSSTGEDIHTPTVHLAIPEPRINHIANLLKTALNQTNVEYAIVETIEKENSEILGAPLFHTKSNI